MLFTAEIQTEIKQRHKKHYPTTEVGNFSRELDSK